MTTELTLSGFTECKEVDNDVPLRQGDIIQWLEGHDDPWKSFGVIVTADCDIANDKHSGILSYAPLLLFNDYVRIFYLPKQLRKGLRSLEEQVVKVIREQQAKNLPNFPTPISESAAKSWALNEELEILIEELMITNSKDIQLISTLIIELKAAHKALVELGLESQLNCLVNLRVRHGTKEDKARNSIWQDIHGFVEKLPGDSFFVNSIGREHTGGYVAYLRLIREITDSQIALRFTDLRSSSVLTKRISRLRSPYLYRLTQQLAEVFSSIGLPREYENNRKLFLQSYYSGNAR